MELKRYQQDVVADLVGYLDELGRLGNPGAAYRMHWSRKGVLVGSGTLPAYQDAVQGAPHVCLKVPTAGGKTFIACNCLRPIFDALPAGEGNLVLWMVPSLAILEQTLRNLRSPEHPYRQRLDAQFAGRVEVFTREEALQGAGFNPDTLAAQLNIVVLSFDSFRAANKEGRKVYQENASLANFPQFFGAGPQTAEADETSLVRVLARMHPLIVVDESHNAQTTLSVEMLRNLNPRFILELTATPRSSSNIISTIRAGALKSENMVKLPVIVYNDHDATQVLQNAISLRGHLEIIAGEQEEAGGPYIRPIVLVQAEPRGGEDAETFERLKQKLVEANIPEQQIAIKTAEINQLRGVDLLAPDCEIRFILTVNALKEGWDCPFAYILATVTNRSSKVEVEQILGRILRQPHARRQPADLLNLSYVFTCSTQFHTTLDEIVRGLNRAGFSEKDYRIAAGQPASEPIAAVQPELAENEQADPVDSIQVGSIQSAAIAQAGGSPSPQVAQIAEAARRQEQEYREEVDEIAPAASPAQPSAGTQPEAAWINGYPMRAQYRQAAKEITVPQYYRQLPDSLFVEAETTETLLSRVHLLEDFHLAGKDTEIDFSAAPSRAYSIDINGPDGGPEYRKIASSDPFYRKFIEFLRRLPVDDLKREIAGRIRASYRKANYLDERDLIAYVERVLQNLKPDQLEDLKERPGEYIERIIGKIESLIQTAAHERFRQSLTTGEIVLRPRWAFPDHIAPEPAHAGLPRSLYEKEGGVNQFEHRVINEVANLDNVLFWHRNQERREFYINGSINHYPDFIVVMKSGKVVLVETKGDDRDNSDSILKLFLGLSWADRAGSEYAYMMVFENNPLPNAWAFGKFIDLVRRM